MSTQPDLYAQILVYASRANPYPLYTELRKTPVLRAQDGSYVVSRYRDVTALIHDPRLSTGGRSGGGGSFIGMDPPEHDRLRRQATRHFDQSAGVRPEMERIVGRLIDRLRGREQVDIVDDFAYPYPVTVICEQLGVPREDEPRFHPWAEAIVTNLDPRPGQQDDVERAQAEMGEYLSGLVERFRAAPGPGLLSGLANEEGMATKDILATARLLLIGGHETTVNLMANGMLTLLRHPHVLNRLRHDPDLAIPLVEELLRYEPPVQLVPGFYVALDDIKVADATIPKGARIVLAVAAANRDPDRFPDPDRFDPDRTDNQHLGFFGGIHYCFGAALARQEAQVALAELARRLDNPRLVEDPPPYRQNPTLRGPRHLQVAINGVW
ncbi:MAG TPA: cytochrome P450 [Streptosporangiaceae bacterium]